MNIINHLDETVYDIVSFSHLRTTYLSGFIFPKHPADLGLKLPRKMSSSFLPSNLKA